MDGTQCGLSAADRARSLSPSEPSIVPAHQQLRQRESLADTSCPVIEEYGKKMTLSLNGHPGTANSKQFGPDG